MKSIKLNLAEVVAKAEKAYQVSLAIKKSAAMMQALANAAHQPLPKVSQPPSK